MAKAGLVLIPENSWGSLGTGPATIFGQTGDSKETLRIYDDTIEAGGIITVSNTVEQIDLPGNSADFQFSARAGQLLIFKADGTLVANFALPADGSPRTIAFGDGGVTVSLGEGNVVSMGTQEIGTDPEAYSVAKGGPLDDNKSATASDSGEQEPSVGSYSLDELYEMDELPAEYILTDLDLDFGADATPFDVASATTMKADVKAIIEGAANDPALDPANVVYTNFNVTDTPGNLGVAAALDAVEGAGVVTAEGTVSNFGASYGKPYYVNAVVVEDNWNNIDKMPETLSTVANEVVLKDIAENVKDAMALASGRVLVDEIVVQDSLQNIIDYLGDVNTGKPTSYLITSNVDTVKLGTGTVAEIQALKNLIDDIVANSTLTDGGAVMDPAQDYGIVDAVAPILADRNLAVGADGDVTAVDTIGNLNDNTAYLGGMLIGNWEIKDTLANIVAKASDERVFNDAEKITATVSGDTVIPLTDNFVSFNVQNTTAKYITLQDIEPDPNPEDKVVINFTGAQTAFVPEKYFNKNFNSDYVIQYNGSTVEDSPSDSELVIKGDANSTNTVTIDPSDSGVDTLTVSDVENVVISGGNGPVQIVDKTGSVTTISGNGNTTYEYSGSGNNIEITSLTGVKERQVSGNWTGDVDYVSGSDQVEITMTDTSNVSITGIDVGSVSGEELEISPVMNGGSVTLNATASTGDVKFSARGRTNGITMVGGEGDDYLTGSYSGTGTTKLVGNDGYDMVWGKAGTNIMFTGSETSGNYSGSTDSVGSGSEVNPFVKLSFLNDAWYYSGSSGTYGEFEDLVSSSNVAVVSSVTGETTIVFAANVVDTLLLRYDGDSGDGWSGSWSGGKIVNVYNFDPDRDKIALMNTESSDGIRTSFDLGWSGASDSNAYSGSGMSVTTIEGGVSVEISWNGSSVSSGLNSGSVSGSAIVNLYGVEITDVATIGDILAVS